MTTRAEEIVVRTAAAAADRGRMPLVMGVLNVTPDSFSDVGRFIDPGRAVEHAINMVERGADIIDIGGESARPGADPITEFEELDRVIPVVRAVAAVTKVPVSIDTRRAAVAAQAMDAGACIVNDVSGFNFDPDMIAVLADRRPIAVAMHMRGSPDTMQTRTGYRSLLGEIVSETMPSVLKAIDAGLPQSRIWLDPGIGFAKNVEQNTALIRQTAMLDALGFPVLVGPSRKTFIGTLTGRTDPSERVFGTAAAVSAAIVYGARIVRVHDVAEMIDVVKVAWAIASADAAGGEERR